MKPSPEHRSQLALLLFFVTLAGTISSCSTPQPSRLARRPPDQVQADLLEALKKRSVETKSPAPSAPALNFRVVGLKGQATSSADGQQWTEVKVGQSFPPGIILRAEPNAILDGKIEKLGAILRLVGSTTALLDNMSGGPDSTWDIRWHLLDGELLGNVPRLNQASQFHIITPAGTAHIRDGEFHLTSDGHLTVANGQSVWKQTGFPDISINPGQSFNAPSSTAAPAALPRRSR